MDTVELKTAYHWHCEECAAANFSLPMVLELTEEEAETVYRDYYRLQEYDELPEDWRSFKLVYIPKTVKCAECNMEYKTMDETTA